MFCSCFLLFRSIVNTEMTKETQAVYDFFQFTSTHTDHCIVILKTDNSVVLIHAAGYEATQKLANLTSDLTSLLAWKVFDKKADAEAFLTRLKGIDKVTITTDDHKPPPMTLPAVEVAGMMEREDIQAEVYAVQEADRLEQLERVAGSHNYATPNEPESKPPALKPSAMNPSQLPVPSFATNPYAKASNSTLEGNPDAVKPDLGMFDMSKVPFNFGKDGNAIGVPIGTELRVSVGLPVKNMNAKIHLVCFWKHKGNLWALDAKFLNDLFKPFIQHTFKDIESAPIFLRTLKDYPICNRANPHKFARSKKGWTQNKPMFLLLVPNGFAKVDSHLTAAFNTLSSYFKESSNPPIGKVFVDWLAMHKESAYNHLTGETSNMKKISHDDLSKQMNTKLINAFKKKIVEYNVPLDTMLSYGHIKEILIAFCRYDGWDDIPHELKSGVVKGFPQNPLPDWASITLDEY